LITDTGELIKLILIAQALMANFLLQQKI